MPDRPLGTVDPGTLDAGALAAGAGEAPSHPGPQKAGAGEAPTHSDEPLIVVEHLRKVFTAGGRDRTADVVAVEGVSFSLAKGGALGIVGESGSGKTTIARMLIGLETPTAGTIRVEGQLRTTGHRVKLAERRRRARQIQIVFQDPYSSLDPCQRVGETLAEQLALHAPGGRSDQRVAELLDQVGLDERMGRALPRDLSGGQRQRVAIARALAAGPAALVLDEAVTALDVSVQAQVLNLLVDIQRETGIAYLFVSHDLAVIRQITDHVLVMEHGRCVESGPTAQILDSPQHAYTVQLRASVPRAGWQPTRRVPAGAGIDHEVAV